MLRAGIKPNDLNEVKKLGKPSDIIKLVFDLVGLLKMEKMVKTEPAEVTMGMLRRPFIGMRRRRERRSRAQASARKNGPSASSRIPSRTCRAACSPTPVF